MTERPFDSKNYNTGNNITNWNDILNKPNLVDWTIDQEDVNIHVENIPALNYAPNSLASNGSAGLTNYNFNQTRKTKLENIADGANVNVQVDWDSTSGDTLILNKPSIPTKVSDLSNDLSFITISTIDDLTLIVNELSSNLHTLEISLNDVYDKRYIDSCFNNVYDKNHIDSSFNNVYTKSIIDASFDDVYNKSYIDSCFNNVYDKNHIDNNFYTKTKIDASFNDVYNKSYIDSCFNNVYDKNHIDDNFYAKTHIDNSFNDVYNKNYIDSSFNNVYNKNYIDVSFNDVYNKNYIDYSFNNLTLNDLSDVTGTDICGAVMCFNNITNKYEFNDNLINDIPNSKVKINFLETNKIKAKYNYIELDAHLKVPNNFIIDPAGWGDDTGNLVLKGNLEVLGETTTINSTTLDICDNRIKLNGANVTDAGIDISINNTTKSFIYNSTNNKWDTSNTNLDVGTGDISCGTLHYTNLDPPLSLSGGDLSNILFGFQTITCVQKDLTSQPGLEGNGSNNVHVFHSDQTAKLTGYNSITCVQYSNSVNQPALRGNNGANNVHVFYAEDAGEAYELKGYQQITCVNDGGNNPSLRGNGSDNVRVNYASTAGYATSAASATITQLVGYRVITSVNHGGHSWLYSQGTNGLHVFYADIAGSSYGLLSDDKIKWNETKINANRSIEIIKAIEFTEYDILKSKLVSDELPDAYDASKCEHGFGVIAQDISLLSHTYPELRDTTEFKEFGENSILTMNYNNLFSLLGATTQNLITRIEQLEEEINILKNK